MNGNVYEFYIPEDYKIGEVEEDGNCFFESFRQGLERLGIDVTVDNLRNDCREFAESNPPIGFMNAISKNYQHDCVRRETVQEYIENIGKIQRGGDPDVEGRILCQRYGVFLYVIEEQLAGNGDVYYTYQLIDESSIKCVSYVDFDKQNTIFMINNGKGYFVPIIHKYFNIMNSSCEEIDQSETHLQKQKHNGQRVWSMKRRLVVNVFNSFEYFIQKGNVKYLKNLINFLYQIADAASLAVIYKDRNNEIRNTHPIQLACECFNPEILDFLLHKTSILCYLPSCDNDTKEACLEALLANSLNHVSLKESRKMLNWLYDYWSGNGHCLNPSNVDDAEDNFKRLKKLLVDFVHKHRSLETFDHIIADIHYLISFSSFQIKLYSRIKELKSNKNLIDSDSDLENSKIQDIVAILLTAINVYEQYSNISIKFSKCDKFIANEYKFESLNQSDYYCYEMYYRKLDYTLALLIINNLDLLKHKLAMPSNIYQQIELSVFSFLSKIFLNSCTYPCQYCRSTINQPRLLNESFLFSEWCKYKQSMGKFKAALENSDPEKSLCKNGSALLTDEVNSFSHLFYMKDYCSLEKMQSYLEHFTNFDFMRDKENGVLIIQRILQITGDLFNTVTDTYNLLPTTLALLFVGIPRNAYKNLMYLRECFSHIGDGKLSKRIHLEQSCSQAFLNVLEDLEEIKQAIHETMEMYIPVLEKELFRLDWLTKYGESEKTIFNMISNKMPKLVQSMLSTIAALQTQHKIWEVITKNLLEIPFQNDILNYPNSECVENIRSELKKVKATTELKKYILSKLDKIKDYREEWLQIKDLIKFIVDVHGYFKEFDYGMEFNHLCESFYESDPDIAGINNAMNLIKMMISHGENYKQQYGAYFVKDKSYNYRGLKVLADIICTDVVDGINTGEMLECLVNRTKLLSTALDGSRDVKKLALRFKNDHEFGITIEMIVSDIINIYNESQLDELINTKYSPLLEKYPLRDLPNHGNLLLEVCSFSKDANDFPTTIIAFALEVVNDESHLNNLFELLKDNVDSSLVVSDSCDQLSDSQQCLVENFKLCNKWQIYVRLLPKKLPINAIEENSEKALH